MKAISNDDVDCWMDEGIEMPRGQTLGGRAEKIYGA
jgi:hypothetical protein